VHGNDALVFLLSLAALLGVARLLGELARWAGLPLVVGEIATGLLLGASGLKRFLPVVHDWLFPSQGAAAEMLTGYTTVSVVLLLVVAGLEVDLGIVKRRGKSALIVAALGVLVPLGGGFILGHALPSSISVGAHDNRTLFALFMGVALSISALPVIAKTLLDLGLFKSDVGLLVMTVAMLDDLIGWVAFSILLGPLHGSGIDVLVLGRTITLAVLFGVICLVPGRRFIDRLLGALEQQGGDFAAGRVLSLVAVVAMLGAAMTQAIGIHAVLGGFIVGVMIGDSPRLRERTRQTIHQFVTNVFAPVFFASVALRVDFIASFDPVLCLVVFVLATATKLIGLRRRRASQRPSMARVARGRVRPERAWRDGDRPRPPRSRGPAHRQPHLRLAHHDGDRDVAPRRADDEAPPLFTNRARKDAGREGGRRGRSRA